jgi:NAD(P)-dependent dehydrogenase (short-subunit alcohol dehydrogenase family)
MSTRSALVTGAARGIGAATARALAARGARVALVGIEPDRLAALAAELGEGHVWFAADVTDQEALDRAVAGTVTAFGGLDAAVVNAGVTNHGTVRTADPEEFARTVDVNLVGAYRTVASVVPHLVERRGYLLLVASAASFLPLPGAAGYSASKAGVEALAATVRLELAHLGVAVGSAHPWWIDTDMVRLAEAALPSFGQARRSMPWPLRTTTSAERCAEVLADAVRRRARRVYVPAWVRGVAALQPLLRSATLERPVRRRMRTLVPALERETGPVG